MKMESLDNRIAFVTGAGSGLGAAIAAQLLEAGARVVLADLAGDRVKLLADALDPSHERTLSVRLDVSQEQSVQAAVALACDRFGGLDVLINNAGTDVTASLEDIPVQAWRRVLDTNLLGPFMLCKAALPALKQSDGGRGGQIVNVASTASVRAWPNASAYHASKWGLLGLSRALHAELRTAGIRVSSLIAGGMRTPFLLDRFPGIDIGKLQDPANVAEAVRFLLTMPRETVVAEMMVLPRDETSWP